MDSGRRQKTGNLTEERKSAAAAPSQRSTAGPLGVDLRLTAMAISPHSSPPPPLSARTKRKWKRKWDKTQAAEKTEPKKLARDSIALYLSLA